MIDSRNGGQTCLQCRNYKKTGTRKDPFFGELPIQSYCTKYERAVHPEQGLDCPAFLKTIFKGNV